MENLDTILMLVVPTGAIILVGQFITKAMTDKANIEANSVLTLEKVKTIYPLQLQAYERLCMLMERLSPDNLIVRLNRPGLNTLQFQQMLFSEINSEYTHNISQQVYVSDKAWIAVKSAVETLKSTINRSANEVGHNEVTVSTDLARRILENFMHQEQDPIQDALRILRAEIRKL